MPTKIALQCAWGDYYGSGHIQRMGALLHYLLSEKGIEAYLVTDPAPSFSSEDISSHTAASISPDTGLIIRDMRDSTEEQISALKRTAPVIVIDDLGAGRDCADLALDLLPNLKYPLAAPSFFEAPFIYGYNFYKAITQLPHKEFAKDVDFCVYAGFNAGQEYCDYLQSLVPSDSSAVILDGKESVLIYHGKK
ncbi:MAG: hypothetical protein ACRCUT_05215, partial [Spirochaetota bacterium]